MFLKSLLAASALTLKVINASPLNYTDSVNLSNLTFALVRTAPPNWPSPLLNKDWTGVTLNISETVDAGIALIERAATHGAEFISFPELWFPGYPKGYDLNNWTVEHLPNYIENSLVVDGPEWNRLVDATSKAKLYAAIAFSELDGDRLYMAQALLSPSGEVLIKRHKLRPSGSERWFFSDGTVEELEVKTTPIGRVGLLECFEHFHPSMFFSMQAQRENIHIASMPYIAELDLSEAQWWEGVLAVQASARFYAINSGAYTFMTSIPYAEVFDPQGYTIALIDSTTDTTEIPILYSTIDASGFNTSKTFDVNDQQSWGVAKEILNSLPKSIPRVEGNLVPKAEHSVAWLLSGALTTEYDNARQQNEDAGWF